MSLKILQWLPTELKNKIYHFTLTCNILYDLAPGSPSDLAAYLSLPPHHCAPIRLAFLAILELLLCCSLFLEYSSRFLKDWFPVIQFQCHLLREAFSDYPSKVTPIHLLNYPGIFLFIVCYLKQYLCCMTASTLSAFFRVQK